MIKVRVVISRFNAHYFWVGALLLNIDQCRPGVSRVAGLCAASRGWSLASLLPRVLYVSSLTRLELENEDDVTSLAFASPTMDCGRRFDGDGFD